MFPAEPVVLPPAFFAAGGPRVPAAPGLPAPSSQGEGEYLDSSDAKRAARISLYVSSPSLRVAPARAKARPDDRLREAIQSPAHDSGLLRRKRSSHDGGESVAPDTHSTGTPPECLAFSSGSTWIEISRRRSPHAARLRSGAAHRVRFRDGHRAGHDKMKFDEGRASRRPRPQIMGLQRAFRMAEMMVRIFVNVSGATASSIKPPMDSASIASPTTGC